MVERKIELRRLRSRAAKMQKLKAKLATVKAPGDREQILNASTSSAPGGKSRAREAGKCAARIRTPMRCGNVACFRRTMLGGSRRLRP